MTDKNASKFIDDLGGTGHVAALTNDRQNTVSGWRKRGIPTRKLLHLIRHAVQTDTPIPKNYRNLLP